MARALTLQEILALGVRTEEGCLVWPRPTKVCGYGRIKVKGKLWVVHRYVWTQIKGPIPEGLTLDHLCHNRAAAAGRCDVAFCIHRACYEVSHLEPKTLRENMLAGRQGMPRINREKTHCHVGHPFNDANTGRDPDGNRFCRTCSRANARARYERLRENPHRTRPMKSHCVNGHELISTNIAFAPTGKWRCRLCMNERAARSRARKQTIYNSLR